MTQETDDHLKTTRGIRGIVADLRDRKVFRSTIAYLVAAWLIVQVSDIVLPAFDAPAWTLRAVITALVFGLPLTIFLAWLYDITPGGLIRRPAAQASSPWSSRWRLAAASLAFLVTAGALWVVWSGQLQSPAQVVTRAAVPLEPVVAVPPLTNLSGDPSLDWLGEGIANLLRDGLAESSHVIVVSKSRWRTFARSAEEESDIPALAAAAGVHYVVSGEILQSASGLLLTARLTDLVSGVQTQAQRISGKTPEELFASTTGLILLIKRGMNVPHTEQVDWFAADFAVDNAAAYETYLSGLEFFLDFRYVDAERAFRAALNLAPDFEIARYRLAQVLAATGRTEAALDTLGQIPPTAPLTDRERAYIDGAAALFARNADEARDGFETLLEQHPYDVEGRLLLAQAFDLAYDDESALRELERLARQEPENERIWSFIGETNLRMGRYEAARAALDRYLRLAPTDPYGFTVLGQVELVTGQREQAVERLEHALELNPGFPRARLALAHAQILGGAVDAAERLLEQLAGDTDAPPGDRIDAAFDLSHVRRATGRFAAALEPLAALDELIAAEQIREAMALATRGTIAIELGDLASARMLIDTAIERSPGVPTRYLFARGQLELARGDASAVRAIAAAIREHALPPDDPDRTEERAAAYLDGMAALSAGDVDAAVRDLRAAAALEGYRYAIYDLGLATALQRAGAGDEAITIARRAASARDSTEVRLDLELDRMRALLLEAQLLATTGKSDQAGALARQFLEHWRDAPRSRPEIALAQRLSATPRS